jgi:hypothetical protein
MKNAAALAILLTILPPAGTAATPAISAAAAGAAFARAHALCSADRGHLWGLSLCGPLMLADPRTRAAVSNVPLPGAERTGTLYRLTLPTDTPISDTPLEYHGVRFAQILWPLAGSADEQAVTLMHESFHRIQPRLGFVIHGARNDAMTIAGDPALDTQTGRIWLRGEIHALRVALRSNGAARKRALADALELRDHRHAILPSTVTPEHELDIMEGLAEATGIDVGLPGARRMQYTLHDMDFVESAPSYARSFCYAIGPAYAELLDAVAPNWRRGVTPDASIAVLAARAYGIKVGLPSTSAAQAVLARYDGAAIEREETTREVRRQARDTAYRAELLQGRTLRLPMRQFKITYKPTEVERFGTYGSVYHQVTVSAAWGKIVVAHGNALIDGSFSSLTVGAPSVLAGSTLHGGKWVLTLSPGANLAPDPKKPGSYTVIPPPPPAPPGTRPRAPRPHSN